MTLAQNLGDRLKGLLGDLATPGPKPDSEILGEIETRYKRARDDRRQYESEWQTNLAFLKGQQWLEWSKQRQSLYLPPAPPWRKRQTTNLVMPTVRSLLAKVMAQPTQGKVQAASDTPEATQDARAQDEFLDYLKIKCDSEEEVVEALKWAVVCGTGIHHPCWDKSLGDELTYPETTMAEAIDPETGQPTQVEQPHPQAGEPVREPGPDGMADESGGVVHMGEIDHIAISPFNFFPEPLAQKIEDMEWAFYVSVRPASYVVRKYGAKVDEETISGDEFLQLNTNGDDTTGPSMSKGVVVKEYWERPNDESPHGRYVVYAGDKLLVNTKNPYPTLPLPFFAVRDSLVPGCFWGRSIVSDLVPLQRRYNTLNSQAAEIQTNTARPKWHIFKNALDAGKTISTAPSEVIVTNVVPGVPDGGRPTKIMGGDVPASFAAETARIETQFFELAGLHDFRRGVQGLGLGRSFAALNLLLEQDDQRIGLLRRENDRAVVAVETAKLKLAKQFYTEPRAISVLGPDQASEIHEFYAEKIPDDVQVRVVSSGALPSSMAARQQYIFELRSQGIITDQRTVRKLLGLANLPGVNDDLDRDIRQAERENEAMKDGTVPAAHDYDNHLIHGQEHDAYRKGEEYEQISQQNPAIVQAFAAHVEQHKQLIQQAMAEAQTGPIPPKITLTGKLTPQQEAQEFGASPAAQQATPDKVPLHGPLTPKPKPLSGLALQTP